MSAVLVPHIPPLPVDDVSSWLTVVLRPAGEVGLDDGGRLARALSAACTDADVVILDLRAVGEVPPAARRAAAEAARALSRSGGALLVVDPDGRHHLDGGAVRIAAALVPTPG